MRAESLSRGCLDDRTWFWCVCGVVCLCGGCPRCGGALGQKNECYPLCRGRCAGITVVALTSVSFISHHSSMLLICGSLGADYGSPRLVPRKTRPFTTSPRLPIDPSLRNTNTLRLRTKLLHPRAAARAKRRPNPAEHTTRARHHPWRCILYARHGCVWEEGAAVPVTAFCCAFLFAFAAAFSPPFLRFHAALVHFFRLSISLSICLSIYLSTHLSNLYI